MAVKRGKRITVNTYNVSEPGTPETGHTALLPDEEKVALDMGNGVTIDSAYLDDDGAVVGFNMDPTLDPVLLWAGKRTQREVPLLPLQRNEIVSSARLNALIERAIWQASKPAGSPQTSFMPDIVRSLRESDREKRVSFYEHEENWMNKLICGDSLEVMLSLLRYEGQRGQVQMIYIDPPYGIGYNSNFQQRIDSTKNDEKDRADDVLSIRAYRDTWELGIHSYLSYLQERLHLCREMLTESGSIFVQISEDYVHLVRQLLDEVFGSINRMNSIVYQKTALTSDEGMGTIFDYILWYTKDKVAAVSRYHQLFQPKTKESLAESSYGCIESPDGTTWRRMLTSEKDGSKPIPEGWRIFDLSDPTSSHYSISEPIEFKGKTYTSGNRYWSTSTAGMIRLIEKGRLVVVGDNLRYKRFIDDFPYTNMTNVWSDTTTGTFTGEKLYTVQTNTKAVERCILMTTEPGDLVFDPTCGSGTTAYAAEKWGRRWITCDTSRVALNVARIRLLSGVFSQYALRNGKPAGGFIYKAVNRVTLKSLANDLESDKETLVDQPEIDKDAIRLCSPFELLTLGRYSAEDWKGLVNEEGKLQNYIGAICRLYSRDAAIQSGGGLVHATLDIEGEKGVRRVALSVGPLTGRVTAKQISDAVMDAASLGIVELHVLGWAYEANVGEIKSRLESRGRIKIQLFMIRPDTLAEGLKATEPDKLFSPLAIPDLTVSLADPHTAEISVTLNGVGVFDRKQHTTRYYTADSNYVAAWYLDEDYDGDCFVDSQMFFDLRKPARVEAALKTKIEADELIKQLTSEPFKPGRYRRIAVKVVDVFGNESTVVHELAQEAH